MHVNLDVEDEMLACLLLMLPAQISQKYDRVEDTTILYANLGPICAGDKHYVSLSAFMHYDGDGREKKKGGVSLYFRGTSAESWKYLDYHSITLLLNDSDRFRFNPDHDGDSKGGLVTEHLFVYPTDPQFQKIVDATSIEGRVGGDRFKLGSRQLELIKRFAGYIADPKAEIRQPNAEEEVSKGSEAKTQPRKEYTEEERKAAEEEGRKQKAASYFNIAENLRRSKKYTQARKMYEEVIRDFSKYPEAQMAKERLKAISKQ